MAGKITFPKPCRIDVMGKISESQNIWIQKTIKVPDKSLVSNNISLTGGNTKIRPNVAAVPNNKAILNVNCA